MSHGRNRRVRKHFVSPALFGACHRRRRTCSARALHCVYPRKDAVLVPAVRRSPTSTYPNLLTDSIVLCFDFTTDVVDGCEPSIRGVPDFEGSRSQREMADANWKLKLRKHSSKRKATERARRRPVLLVPLPIFLKRADPQKTANFLFALTRQANPGSEEF
jgi:hypothetical protein